ncbi:MAG TPA: four helix bundle protein [Bacteroidia bacterium]|jgi:four helix bundle protein|nr:four helix bundle protein [Bacteroidia bacterium]
MKIKKFEDIIAWQKAQTLTIELYSSFSQIKDYGFKEQICRASISISNNIAEGFDRSSDADFKRFLHISLGSCSEVRSMLYLAEKLKYIDMPRRDFLIQESSEVSKILWGLIKSISPKD